MSDNFQRHVHGGLKNVGNTCFLNATLQALFHIPSFVSFIVEHRKGCFSLLECTVCAIYRTWLNMRVHQQSSPQALLRLLPKIMNGIKTGDQQDADDFLCSLMNKVEEEALQKQRLNNNNAERTTGIGEIFNGSVKSIVRCSICCIERSTKRDESSILVQCLNSSLQGAINEQLDWEVIDGLKCDSCGNIMMKKESYTKHPNVLKVVIKRFDSDSHFKVRRRTVVPKVVKLEGLNYTFISGVVHHGPSMENGHYTCVASCPGGVMSSFDDEKVIKIHTGSFSNREILEGMYIVFYEREQAVPLNDNTQNVSECRPVSDGDRTEFGIDPSLKIVRGRKVLPKSASSQSSLDYWLGKDNMANQGSDSTPTECGVVSPIKIVSSKKVSPRATLPQPSHVDRLENHKGALTSCPLFHDIDIFEKEVIENPPVSDVYTMDNQQYVPVRLSEHEIVGATLPKKLIGANLKKDLKRWLQCRGIPVSNVNKETLVALVKSCKELKRDHIIRPGIDNSQQYEAKRSQLLASQGVSCSVNPQHIPHTGWDQFPSCDLPRNFNFGSVYHYLVEAMPAYAGDDASESGSSGDEEEEEVVQMQDPFDNCENKEMLRSKKLRRGLVYLKSNYITGCQDVVEGRVHFFKGHVRASMNKTAYWVHVAVSEVSGRIIFCRCDDKCVQRSLGRCSHVGAMLLFILGHIRLNGYQAITCTSRQCEWNQGALNRDPQVSNERQYESFKIDVKRRATFDVRPTRYQHEYPTPKEINSFLSALSYKDSHWSLLLKIEYEDGEYELDDILGYFPDLRDQLYVSLKTLTNNLKHHANYKGPMEVKETRGQSNNIFWSNLRSLHVTASTCRKVVHFKTESAKMNHLQRHLWNMKNVRTKAMAYGIRMEAEARKAYLKLRLMEDPTVCVQDTGLFLHTEHLGLSCSPDGSVTSDNHPPRILEIKCPYTLRNCHPREFEKVIPQKRIRSFYLLRSANNEIILNNNHEYYDQIQMNLGMTCVQQCDLVVWSKEGILVIPVAYDEKRWEAICIALKSFHWDYHAPEYFLQRTVRNLPPLLIP